MLPEKSLNIQSEGDTDKMRRNFQELNGYESPNCAFWFRCEIYSQLILYSVKFARFYPFSSHCLPTDLISMQRSPEHRAFWQHTLTKIKKDLAEWQRGTVLNKYRHTLWHFQEAEYVPGILKHSTGTAEFGVERGEHPKVITYLGGHLKNGKIK